MKQAVFYGNNSERIFMRARGNSIIGKIGLVLAISLIILLSAVIINKIQNFGTDAPNETGSVPVTKPPIKNEEKTIKELTYSEEMVILVNKLNDLPSDYEPGDLTKIAVYAPGRDESARYMRAEAADQMNLMLADAKAAGKEVLITTAYRAYWLQKAIFESNVAKKGSVEEANKTSAKPGQSEHQTGLAADLTTPGLNYEISSSFGETPEGIWITENARKYGFILRYPKDRTEITGYAYEPWHFRYVGKDAADYIFKNGLTLEEFLTELNQ